MLLSKALGMQ
jgi:chromosome segregation ATPase